MVLPRFSSRVFMVQGLMFKSLIHLKLIFTVDETDSEKKTNNEQPKVKKKKNWRRHFLSLQTIKQGKK